MVERGKGETRSARLFILTILVGKKKESDIVPSILKADGEKVGWEKGGISLFLLNFFYHGGGERGFFFSSNRERKGRVARDRLYYCLGGGGRDLESLSGEGGKKRCAILGILFCRLERQRKEGGRRPLVSDYSRGGPDAPRLVRTRREMGGGKKVCAFIHYLKKEKREKPSHLYL